jgi:hypothetical protein
MIHQQAQAEESLAVNAMLARARFEEQEAHYGMMPAKLLLNHAPALLEGTMRLRRIFFLLFFLSIPQWLVAAQETPRILTNADIIKMANSGIGEQTIILTIRKSSTKFDTSPDALVQLKSVGVPDAVLDAMLNASPSTLPNSPTANASQQDCSQRLDRALASMGPPEKLAAVHAMRLMGTSVVTKPSGSATFQVERIVVLPSNIYISLQPTKGVGGMTVVTPEFNYLTSGKMTSSLPVTTLQELEYGHKLDLIYIAQHRDQYGCVLVGSGKFGNVDTSRLEIEGEGVKGQFEVDSTTGRLLRTTFQSNPPAQTVADSSDWRLVDGIYLPFKRHVVTSSATTDLTVSELQVNPTIDPAMFQPPAGVVATSVSLKVLQSESVPYTVETNGGISTACKISGSTNTSMTASTYGSTTYGTATSTPNLQMNCKSTDTTIRWTHVLNSMFVVGSDGNAYIIACDRAWAWSKCKPLRVGDTFLAKRGDKGFIVQSLSSKSKEQEATYSILQSRSLHE